MIEFIDSPTVVVRNVWKRYLVERSRSEDVGNRRRLGKNTTVVDSLKSISFVAEAGESIGIIGRNGSGKSTLLKIIAGSEVATEGQIFVKSRPTLLGVSPVLQPYLSGEQNIYLGCLAIGMSKKEAREEVPKIAEWAQIGDAIRRPMSTYSAGQNARLVFAISTAVKPEILLVDEALSTGDAAFSRKAEKRMTDLLEGAGNLFLVSHNTGQVAANCERVLWLNNGELIADGPSKHLLPQYSKWSSANADGNDSIAADLLEDISKEYSPKELTSLQEFKNKQELQ